MRPNVMELHQESMVLSDNQEEETGLQLGIEFTIEKESEREIVQESASGGVKSEKDFYNYSTHC
jgi:hypothetical protein